MYREMLTKLSLILILTLYVTPGTGIAAYGGFKISDYIPERFQDLKWQVSANARGSAQDNTQDSSTDYDKRDDNSYTTGGSTAFGYRYETPQEFFTTDIGLSLGYGRYEDNHDEDIIGTSHSRRSLHNRRSREFSSRWIQNLGLGKYVYGDIFMSAHINAWYDYSEVPSYYYRHAYTDVDVYFFGDSVEERHYDMTRDSRAHSHTGRVSVEVMSGWGRSYEGWYASTAMYMIEELKGAGILVREPTQSEMLEFTEVVYQYRLKHAIDSRQHRIEALSHLLEYLTDKGIIDDPGAQGPYLLYDVWTYFPRDSRRFGFDVRAGAGLIYSNSSMHATDLTEVDDLEMVYDIDSVGVPDTLRDFHENSHHYSHFKSTGTQGYLIGAITYHNPLDRRWQLDALGEVRYYVNGKFRGREYEVEYLHSGIPRETTVSDINQDDFVSLYGHISATYILNSRTKIDVSTSYHRNRAGRSITTHFASYYSYARGYRSVRSSAYRPGEWSASMGLSGTYRISIPTTLKVGVSYSHRESHVTKFTSREVDDNRLGASVSLSHYLF